MQDYPMTSLSTLVVLAIFFWTAYLVGKARQKFGVAAPAVSGHEQFDRRFRVQMNTLEQLILLLPLLWLCALWIGDPYAALGGLVWSIGRVIYALSYIADPKKRGPGFALTMAPTMIMAVAVAVKAIERLI
jgi:glutathione S-transferase